MDDRILDMRITSAMLTGKVEGHPPATALEIAYNAMILLECRRWIDARFQFPGLAALADETYSIPISGFGLMVFGWSDTRHAIDLRLRE